MENLRIGTDLTARERGDRTWAESLDLLASFVAGHARWPRTGSVGDERTLATWLSVQRSRCLARRLNTARFAQLNDTVPGWSFSSDAEAGWLSRAADLAAFVEACGVVPSEHSADNRERSLGRWTSNLRRVSETEAGVRADRAAFLDACAPPWRTNLWELTWEQHLADIVQFRSLNDRLPSEDAVDAVERAAGAWLAKQCDRRRRSGALSAKRSSALDEQLPGWQLKLVENSWLTNATAVAEFVSEFERTPKKASANVDERRLGTWLHNQRIRLDVGKAAHRTRIALLNQVVDGWRATSVAEAA